MKYLVGLFLLLFAQVAYAVCPDPVPDLTICLEWQAPTQNVDGTPLTDLASFTIYHGFATGSYEPLTFSVNDALATDQSLDRAGPGVDIVVPSPGPQGGDVDVFFAMTASDASGNESALSNEVLRTVTFPDGQVPGVPTLVRVLFG